MAKVKSFVLTSIDSNHNKFWKIDINGTTVTTYWGRVGDNPQKTTFPFQDAVKAQKFYNKKIAEKEKKGYREINIVAAGNKVTRTADVSLKEACSQIDTNCRELIDYLISANIHNIVSNTTISYNARTQLFETPLGVVDKKTIDSARSLLTIMGTRVQLGQYDFERDAESYFMYIPTNIGRSKPNIQKLFPNMDAVQKQNDILDSLEASLNNIDGQASDNAAPVIGKLFDCKIHLEDDKKVIQEVREFYHKTRQNIHVSHTLDVKRVFNVELFSLRQNFKKDESNIWKLWHGTKTANLLSILKNGLMMPKTMSNGWNFGPGIYFSDQSTKSLNYAHGYWSGQYSDRCYMFIANVAMGNYYDVKSSSDRNNFPRPGHPSVFARAKQSGILNNEMIVFNTNQVDLIQLVEFEK